MANNPITAFGCADGFGCADSKDERRWFATPPKDTPKALLPYLCHTGSLTERLEHLGGASLQVELGFVGFCLYPNNNKRQMAWVRQVTLGVAGQAWVEAKTVIFASELKGATRQLQFIKERPIGYVLFKRQRQLPFERWFFKTADKSAKAIPNYHNTITDHNKPDNNSGYNNAVYDNQNNQNSTTQSNFGRVTAYDWQGRQVLVEEIFLGEFLGVLKIC